MQQLPPAFLFSYGKNRNLLLVSSLSLESYDTVRLGVQRIILADSNVLTGMDPGAALSVKDVSGLHELSVRSLGAQSLWTRNHGRSLWSRLPFYEQKTEGSFSTCIYTSSKMMST